MACDRHETGPGNETCPDCLFAMLVETRRALNESESWAESQEREVDRLRSHVSRLEESLGVALKARAEAVEVLKEVEWNGPRDMVPRCPCCEYPGLPSGLTGPAGHAKDCRLARAIGGAK